MQGVCIDAGLTTTLKVGQKYFLFEHGVNNFYVSNFNSVRSHFGSFQRKYFELIQEANEDRELFIDGFQVAKIVKTFKGYNFDVGDRYVVGPTRINRGTHFYLYNLDNMRFRGCMPVDMFELIKPFEGIPVKRQETAKLEVLDDPGTNALNVANNGQDYADLKVEMEQMDLFDFMEG